MTVKLEDKVAMFLINQVLCSTKSVVDCEAGIAMLSGKHSESGSVYSVVSGCRRKAVIQGCISEKVQRWALKCGWRGM